MKVERKILLNPGPAATTDTVKLAQVVPDICPREKEFVSLMKSVRTDLLRVVHANEKKYAAVPFCGSGTICMDVCLNSLLPADKKVLIVNNGAYSSRAVEICEYYGLPYVEARFSETEMPDLHVLEEMLKEDPEIAVVYSTHNETGTGFLNPIREIGGLAHRYGAISIVDTTSTFAMRPIDIAAEQIDFCMSSAQKGLQGMTGLSYIIGDREWIRRSASYPRRSYYCNLFLQFDYFERTGEMHFTPPVQTIYALRQALDEYFAEGEEEKWKRHTRVYREICSGLHEMGFRTLIDEEYQAGLVVSAVYPADKNWDFQKVHDYCYERGYTIYPGIVTSVQTFRLCAFGQIDREDIQSFFAVFQEALGACHIKLPVVY